jgi:hypothetical protein
MEINRHLSILLVLVAASFAVTTLSISPAWAVTGGPKKAYTKAEKRHASSGARRIKEVNGSYVAQAKPQNVANAPAAGCYGGWAQSLNGPVYISWCPPATPYSGTSGQTSGWAAPAGASGSQTGAAPMTGGYTSQPPPGSVCYSSCVPCWSGPVDTWSRPATTYSGISGQTGGWAAPAQASGGYVPPPPSANVGSLPATACTYGGWVPCAPASAPTGNVCSATVCY